MAWNTYMTDTGSKSGKKNSVMSTQQALDIIKNAQAAAAQNAAKQNSMYGNKGTSAATVASPTIPVNSALTAGAVNGAAVAAQPSNSGYYSDGSSASSGTLSTVNQNQNLLDLLQKSYEKSLANNQTQYDNTVARANSAYGSGLNSMNKTADQALKEAYIQNMIAQRDMKQNLTASGMSGGMSETTMAKLANNYGNSRNSIEASRSDNVASLAQTLLQSIYDAASQLSERNSEDAQNYYTQAAQYGYDTPVTTSTSSSSSNNYKTNQNWIKDYVAVQQGTYDKETIRKNAQALISAYGTEGYKALLSGAQY